ncbi:MAG: BrnA antitoxin family protein [Alphaproteobacteria bacterium]
MTISKRRLAEIEAIPDDAIDTSDIPEMDASFFETARLVMPSGQPKKAISMRIDEDVLEWFRAQGKGHLTRMSAVLRAYMLESQSNAHGFSEAPPTEFKGPEKKV